MLIYGETPAEHKAWIYSNIHTNREALKALNKPEHSEATAILRNEIREWLTELVELERWRLKEGYGHDQPFKPKSLIEYEASLSDDEREDYMTFKAELQEQIDLLEYERSKENE